MEVFFTHRNRPVSKGQSGCIIGFDTASKLGLVNILNNLGSADQSHLKTAYPSVFSGKIGKLKDVVFHLHVDKLVKPVVQKHRHIPFHLRDALEKELA